MNWRHTSKKLERDLRKTTKHVWTRHVAIGCGPSLALPLQCMPLWKPPNVALQHPFPNLLNLWSCSWRPWAHAGQMQPQRWFVQGEAWTASWQRDMPENQESRLRKTIPWHRLLCPHKISLMHHHQSIWCWEGVFGRWKTLEAQFHLHQSFDMVEGWSKLQHLQCMWGSALLKQYQAQHLFGIFP